MISRLNVAGLRPSMMAGAGGDMITSGVPSIQCARVIYEVGRVSQPFGHPAVNPGNEEFEFARREADVVRECAVAALGRPWRHAARERLFLDGFCPRARLRVGAERHRHLSLGVALQALPLEQRGDPRD